MYKKVHSAIMRVYRIILGYEKSQTMNDDAVITELGVMCPRTLLRARRVCAFVRIVASPFLTSLVMRTRDVKRSWVSACFDDLKWLSIFPEFRGCCEYTLEEWIANIGVDPKQFRRKVVKVCSHPFANVVTEWATCPSLDHFGGTFVCSECNKHCKSKQSIAVHKFKKHGIKCIERRYLDTTHCPICLLEIWTRERALNHLRYRSEPCRENLLLRPPILSEAQADEIDEVEAAKYRALRARGLRRHAAEKPCVQALGPLWPIVVDPSRFSRHHPLGKGHRLQL